MRIDEQGLIGCILINQDSIYEVYKKIKPEMFQNLLDRSIYTSMIELYEGGRRIDIPTIWTRLDDRFERKDFEDEVKTCVTTPTTSAEIKGFASNIESEYKVREVNTLFNATNFNSKDINEQINVIYSTLEVMRNKNDESIKTLEQIVNENEVNYFKDIDKKRINTGFWKLDNMLGGLEGGDVTVIGARPAVGKSALVTQIISNVASQGHKVIYFNLEMNESQVYERMLSKAGALSLNRVRHAKAFLNDEETSFKEANKKLKGLPVIVSTGSKTVSQIKAECRHQDVELIVIDYLQLLKADRFYQNRASEVGDISKSIKGLAMELHVPILILSQLNRVSEHRENKEPAMSELRESGDIEQDASQIILLWNMSENDVAAKGMVVCKNRMGEVGKIGLRFDGEHMTFEERYEDFSQFERTVRTVSKPTEEYEKVSEVNQDTPFC